MAAASGDISSLIRLISGSASLTVADYIEKTVGNLMFTYFAFIDHLHVRPTTLEDLIDGLLYIEAKAYSTQKHLASMKEGSR